MHASATKLQLIIEGTKQYIVPMFQRTYTWESREWDALWDDIIETASEPGARDHFIGSIVTIPTHAVPEGVTKYILIDGQQRLTTVYILLAAIRDAARSIPGTLADEIDHVLLTNQYKTGTDSLKLYPTQGDRKSFVAIMGCTTQPEQSQIARAYKHFDRKLRSKDLPSLDVIKRTIVERLEVVSVVLDHDDNPHLIFESLNAKGQPLSQADLIRNYFFMRIDVSNQEHLYQTYWLPMQDALAGNLTEYIRHFMMKDGTSVRQGDVYSALKQRADGKHTQEEVVDYLRTLAEFAKYYVTLLRPSEESCVMIQKRMERLNRIEVTTAYPLLLNLLHDRAQGRHTSHEVADILDVLENYLIRRYVCNVPTNQLNKIFSAIYAQASQHHSIVDGIKEALRTRNYPRNAEFRDRLVSSKLYRAGVENGKPKIILEQLETSFGHKESVPSDNLTIEHVMPQTLTDWWKHHLGPDWEVAYETLLDTLGNLTLTAYNSPLSNAPFSHKKQILGQSHVELNSYFASVPNWDEAAIRRRAAELAERALSVWPYFGLDAEAPTSSDQAVTGRAPKAVTILGQRYEVETWREVEQHTLETIALLDEDRMVEIISKYPKFVGKDPTAFRQSRQLASGLFIEVNLSADAIYRFCIQATEVAGLTSDEWQVDLVNN